MISTRVFLFTQVAAFWLVWRWYVQRMLDGSDEPWGILALATVMFILIKKASWSIPCNITIFTCSALVMVYMACYAWLPPLFRGVIAVTALSFSLSSICYGRTLQVGIAGLLLVSLPLIASLQFYGGFPIRVITAFVSSQLLNVFGYQVLPQGTLLYWLGEVIAVDAPCAGIKMLWTGLYLNFSLAAWRNLGLVTTWLSTSITLFSVFIGNIFRATLLFFTESGIVNAPDFAHQAIGLVVFAFVAFAVLAFHQNDRSTIHA